MQIKWLGHASFLITSLDNIKIITDPYTTGHGLKYGTIEESADIVTVSHGHSDHNNINAVKNNPEILSKAGSLTAKGIKFTAVPVFHDDVRGKQRGNDLIFCFQVDGINLCHLGDLGHQLTQEQIREISPIDILFIPVGGYYTIDAEEATRVVQML
jgi:L-ascorbate metabolism protein UlaG (beta-lactamase superfamily)